MYDHVIWPLLFDPKTSAIYALNDIDVNAQPEVAWKLLVDAENWSSYFPAEDQVKILTGEPELDDFAKGGWRILPILTEPESRLASISRVLQGTINWQSRVRVFKAR
jgi:hypothetical protein